MRGLAIAVVAVEAIVGGAAAAEPARFAFEAVTSVKDMRALVGARLSSPTTRDQVRSIFVTEGGATLVAHPRKADVEKYIYDIDLCSYYVWRWNISADYSAGGRLRQVYVNAEPVLGDAMKPPLPSKGPFFSYTRPRPQAHKGESSLAAVIADRDGDDRTLHDALILMGVGPTRADPLNMGHVYPYSGELWRSIFDPDEVKAVVPYAGDCAAVEAEMARRLAREGAK